MTIGNRDTLITFEAKGEPIDDPLYGPQPGTWGVHSHAWAEVRDVLPGRSESLADGMSLSRQPARIRIDYLDGVGITSAMRITIPGDAMRPARNMRIISGPSLFEKSDEWELMAEQLSTQGQEA